VLTSRHNGVASAQERQEYENGMNSRAIAVASDANPSLIDHTRFDVQEMTYCRYLCGSTNSHPQAVRRLVILPDRSLFSRDMVYHFRQDVTFSLRFCLMICMSVTVRNRTVSIRLYFRSDLELDLADTLNSSRASPVCES